MKTYIKIFLITLAFLALNSFAKAQTATTFDTQCDSLCMLQKRLDLQILEIQYAKAKIVKTQKQQVTAAYEAANEAYLKAVAELDFTLQNQITAYTRIVSLQKAELYARFRAKWESQISNDQIERCSDRCPPPIR